MNCKLIIAILLLLVGSQGFCDSNAETLKPPRGDVSGVVVREVGLESALKAAGIQEGDIVLGWERPTVGTVDLEPSAGYFHSVIDWWALELEQAPRGSLLLRGERAGRARVWEVGPGDWDVEVLPFWGAASPAPSLWAGQAHAPSWLTPLRWSLPMEYALEYGVEQAVLFIAHDLLQFGVQEQRPDLIAKVSTAIERLHLTELEEAYFFVSVGEDVAPVELPRELLERNCRALEDRQPESLTLARCLHLLGKEDLGSEGSLLNLQRSIALLENAAPTSQPMARAQHSMGNLLLARGRPLEAKHHYDMALSLSESQGGSCRRCVPMLENLADLALALGALGEAEEYLSRELALADENRMQLDVADALSGLGAIALERGDLVGADNLLGQSLALLRRVAPEGRSMAVLQNRRAILAVRRGDLNSSRSLFRCALELATRDNASPFLAATILGNLCVLCRLLDRPLDAGEYCLRAIKVHEENGNSGVDYAEVLTSLGELFFSTGDISEAEVLLGRATSILEEEAPESLTLAQTLMAQGEVASQQEAKELAAVYYERAIAILEDQVPRSEAMVGALFNAAVSTYKVDLVAGASYGRRALSIAESSLEKAVGPILLLLGRISRHQGKIEEAEVFTRRGLSRADDLDQATLTVLHASLADILLAKGEVGAAENHIKRAIELDEMWQLDLYSIYVFAGDIYRAKGELEVASRFFLKSLSGAEDSEVLRVLSPQEKPGFLLWNVFPAYVKAIDLAVYRHRWRRAFELMERSRAQVFRELLGKRDTKSSAQAMELQRRRRDLAEEYDHLLELTRGLSPVSDEEVVTKVREDVRLLRKEQLRLEREILGLDPRFARFDSSRPLDVAGAAAALDNGTVVLAYQVVGDDVHLFVLTKMGLVTVHSLGIDEESVENFVRELREEMIVARSSPRLAAKRLRELDGHLRWGYDLLVKPAEDAVRDADRVLVLPDGVLYGLPFSALQREDGYLVEWKPIHYATSMTQWAELKKRRRSSGEESSSSFIGFALSEEGDDVSSSEESHLAVGETQRMSYLLAGAVRSNVVEELPQLKASAFELAGISELFEPGLARVYVGREATEKKFKEVSSGADFIHFATHATVDDAQPWNSGLVLSPPETIEYGLDNGFLQAWEIMQDSQLHASLVTLSACNTALGRDYGGEGIIGLTRAFHHAGAATVLSSLWSVADTSTAALMIDFYRHLMAGKTKDEALRQAQLGFVHGTHHGVSTTRGESSPEWSAPYFWAAFQVYGDWK